MHGKAPRKTNPSRTYTRVDPNTLTKDDKSRQTQMYRTPQMNPHTLPKQVPGNETRGSSPSTMPSLLDMVKDNLKLTELPPDLVKILEKDGETMVHEYYAMKANKIIEHNRNIRELPLEKKTFPQESDMTWARVFMDAKLEKAKALVQARVIQQNAQAGPQNPQISQLHPHGTSCHHTFLTQRWSIQPPQHTGDQISSERDLGLVALAVPMTNGGNDAEIKRGLGDPGRSQRATVEADDESEISSWDGRNGYTVSESYESPESVTTEEHEEPMDTNTSAWRDEWAISEQGTYYS